MNSPNKRYTIHFSIAMIAYMVILFGSVWTIEGQGLTGWPAGLLAIAPMLPALYALHAFVVRFRQLDEFQRRIASEAILWAAGIVGFAGFGYGFLEGAVEVPDIGLIWVLPALAGVYGLVQCVLFWRTGR